MVDVNETRRSPGIRVAAVVIVFLVCGAITLVFIHSLATSADQGLAPYVVVEVVVAGSTTYTTTFVTALHLTSAISSDQAPSPPPSEVVVEVIVGTNTTYTTTYVTTAHQAVEVVVIAQALVMVSGTSTSTTVTTATTTLTTWVY